MMSAALLKSDIDAPLSDAAPCRVRTHWSGERVTALGDLFEAGWSHELMGQALGLSKGAISAKLDRLMDADPKRWCRTATIVALKPDRSASAAKAEERRAQAAKARAVEGGMRGRFLTQLTPHDCRWPLAFVGEQTFCAAERALPSSYCSEHEARSRVRLSR